MNFGAKIQIRWFARFRQNSEFLDTVYSTYLKWLKGTIGHHWIARHHKHIPLYGSACLKSYFWILNFAIHFMKTYLILHATQLGLIVECPHKCIHLYWKRENKKVSKGEKFLSWLKFGKCCCHDTKRQVLLAWEMSFELSRDLHCSSFFL